MKKTVLITAILGVMALGSCCNKQCNDENKCCKGEGKCACCAPHHDEQGACVHGDFKHHHPQHSREMSELEKKWNSFDSLTVEEQKVVIAERKARIDERDSMIKAAREEFETKWANFDKLSIEEQKMLLDAKINFHHNGRFSRGQREMGPQCKTDKCGKQDSQKKPCKK